MAGFFAQKGGAGMTKRRTQQVHIGYEVGTGKVVSVPLAHIFVTGQTQVSGKTTTLQAIVARSGCRALAFVTKRGEDLDGRHIQPYLPREGEQEIHWRYVETIMASALGQKGLKYERLQIIAAAKNARSLEDVRRNVERLYEKHKKDKVGGIYELLGAYLDLVLPEMRSLKAVGTLDLKPGLNVMRLEDATPELQALVIGAAIQRINEHDQGVLTVFPEAWQFAPRDRNTAAKFQAEKMARMGAGIGNYLLCDSQDIAGVSPVVRQASTVWIIGAQREANELRRTLDVIKSSGIKAPKTSEVGTLQLGQFFACFGSNAIKTYVQPAWMGDDDAIAIATAGGIAAAELKTGASIFVPPAPIIEQPQLPADEPAPIESEDDVSNIETNARLDQLIEIMSRQTSASPPPAATNGAAAFVDEDAMYQRFKARLLKEPQVLRVLSAQPELQISVEKNTVEMDGTSLIGRAARLIHRGWLDEVQTNAAIVAELGRTGGKTIAPRVSEAMARLKGMGFVTNEANGWKAVAGMKRSITQKS
jgi:hypothetical protein